MKKAFKVVVILLGVVVLCGAVFFLWAKSAAATKLEQSYETHDVDFPIPFPLSASEVAQLRKQREQERAAEVAEPAPEAGAESGEPTEADEAPPPAVPDDVLAGVDLDAIARTRAIARGKHLVDSRYVCVECHGDDFSGGTMVDDPAIGQLFGPNITRGKGGKTAAYTARDWDRIVRHGVKPDGKAGAMPSEDFQRMSDQELSDIVTYIRSRPAVDNEVAPISLGPLGTVLMATGKLPLSADLIHAHDAPHPKLPPNSAPTAEFGEHLTGICTGCHRSGFEGGPIPAGPPDWVPAANLTPHADGLQGWSHDDFVKVMRTGTRPDGTHVRAPMDLVAKYGQRMSDLELRAMWEFISTRPALPTGQ